jgi:hypothetical protein
MEEEFLGILQPVSTATERAVEASQPSIIQQPVVQPSIVQPTKQEIHEINTPLLPTTPPFNPYTGELPEINLDSLESDDDDSMPPLIRVSNYQENTYNERMEQYNFDEHVESFEGIVSNRVKKGKRMYITYTDSKSNTLNIVLFKVDETKYINANGHIIRLQDFLNVNYVKDYISVIDDITTHAIMVDFNGYSSSMKTTTPLLMEALTDVKDAYNQLKDISSFFDFISISILLGMIAGSLVYVCLTNSNYGLRPY